MNWDTWVQQLDFGTRAFWCILLASAVMYALVEILAHDLLDMTEGYQPKTSRDLGVWARNGKTYFALLCVALMPYVQVFLLGVCMFSLVMVFVAWCKASRPALD